MSKIGSICAEKDRAVKDAQKRERREARAAARKANANEGGASDKLITISHAACIIGVSPTTLRAWIDKGELPTWVSPGGRVRVREEDARGFWQRRGNTPK